MNRQASYSDANANSSAYAASAAQMQHISAQRMQQNAGMNSFPGRRESFPAEQGNSYVSPQWERDTMSHPYAEARQTVNSAQSYHHGQLPLSKVDVEKESNREPRVQSSELDMEIGYEDTPLPLTLEGIEQKFRDEILKLMKEQMDEEDAENARHREKIIDINNQYQGKLSALRGRQASRREEFLHKESEARFHQYQQNGLDHPVPRSGPNDLRGYAEPTTKEDYRAYPTGQYDGYRERPPFLGSGRGQGTDRRVPYPEGRVYNNAGARYF